MSMTLTGCGKGQGAASVPCYYLDFDGNDDILTLPLADVPDGSTIVLWIKRDNGTAQDGIMGPAAADYWYLNGATSTARTGAGTSTSTATFNTTDWVHVAFVIRNGAAAIHYKNGVDVTNAATILTRFDFDEIGRILHNNTYAFGGYMAAIGIAPSVLNVPAMWAAGDFHKPLDPAVFTFACWNMRSEGGAGQTLVDESASARNCTFKGAGEPAWGGTMAGTGPVGWAD